VHAFASTVGRAGRSVEVGREVIRFNPLGLNEGATAEAQLWVLMNAILACQAQGMRPAYRQAPVSTGVVEPIEEPMSSSAWSAPMA